MHRSMNTFVLACLALILAGPESHAGGGTVVACVGDSITKGVDTDPGQDVPAQLGRMLGTEYTVSGFAASGVTATQAAPRPYRDRREYPAALCSNPSIVVIMLGTNNTKPACFKGLEQNLWVRTGSERASA